VGRWLGRFADRDWAAPVGSLRVERYLTPRAYQSLWTPLDLPFADNIRLRAYRMIVAPAVSAAPQSSASALGLVLYWQAAARPSKDYTVFVHLLNEAGVLVAQQDNPPVYGTYPTSQWQPGPVVVDSYAIIIPDALPHGRYRFEVGLYDAGGVRLRAGADDKLVFGEMTR
jgi:hypothetical protein